MERLLQGKIQSVLAFLHTVVQAAVKGLLARSDPSPKRFFKGRDSIMVVVPCGSCSYDKMNLALAGLNPLIGGSGVWCKTPDSPCNFILGSIAHFGRKVFEER